MSGEWKDLTNRIVAGYRVLHRLGRGGMSEVYLAFHENLRRHVALKVLRHDLVGSVDHKTRFLREARAAASLIHPNIVQVYDIGEFENVHYIAQEYIAGNNLRAYIQRRGSLPVDETLSILLQTVAALQKADSAGIVHRDIKPENILLTSEGEVKVADFGVAWSKGQETNLTEIGITLGTPLYMSPEQIQGLAVDSRSDLYSLGVTAYHMLSGRTPFEGDTALALALQHLQNPPTDLASIRPNLPEALCRLVAKLLAKKPSDRYGSAAEVFKELREIAKSLPGRWHGDQLLPLTELVMADEVDLTNQTIRLQTAMIAERTKKRRQRLIVAAQALLFVFCSAGAFLFANQWRRVPLIQNPSLIEPDVPPKANIQEQFLYALYRDELAEWQAIEKHFPPTKTENLHYNLKAWLHLGRVARDKHNSWSDAESAFQKILDHYRHDPDSVDKVYRVLAYAGLMSVEIRRDPSGNRWKEFRDRGREFESGLDDKQRDLVRSAIPPAFLKRWESSE